MSSKFTKLEKRVRSSGALRGSGKLLFRLTCAHTIHTHTPTPTPTTPHHTHTTKRAHTPPHTPPHTHTPKHTHRHTNTHTHTHTHTPKNPSSHTRLSLL